MSRNRLPNRRRLIRQKARIGGQTYYLELGLYPNGQLGEIFLIAAKEGAFARGALDGLGRMASIALQSGTAWPDVVKAIRELHFQPDGQVQGSDYVAHCTSVADWVAQEIEAFCSGRTKDAVSAPVAVQEQSDERSGDESVSILPSSLEAPKLLPAVTLHCQEDLVFALGVGDGNVSPSLEQVAGPVYTGSGV